MSSFKYEKCDADILDSPEGYTTGCEHYPVDVTNLARKSPILFIADVLAGRHEGTVLADRIKTIFDE